MGDLSLRDEYVVGIHTSRCDGGKYVGWVLRRKSNIMEADIAPFGLTLHVKRTLQRCILHNELMNM